MNEYTLRFSWFFVFLTLIIISFQFEFPIGLIPFAITIILAYILPPNKIYKYIKKKEPTA